MAGKGRKAFFFIGDQIPVESDKNHQASCKAEINKFIWISFSGKIFSCHTSIKRKFEQHIIKADRGLSCNECWICGSV